VIDTPTPTATKWWPGELGRFATHAVLFAQVIIDGKNYGVLPFIIQLRDLETHKHLPGIKSGDMGPKLGYSSKENGWATFNNVRVSRSQLL
jgi:acyl-CoA oxidase